MPLSEQSAEHPESSASPLEFKTSREVKAYQDWKKEVPAVFRGAVEAGLLKSSLKKHKELTPGLADFHYGVQALVENPTREIDALPVDNKVKNQLRRLQQDPTDTNVVTNIFALLSDPKTNFETKKAWYEARVRPRLEWIQQQDQPQEREEGETPEMIPPPQEEELTPSMDELEEEKEGPSEGFYEVSPYYGGYYRGGVFEHWDQQALKWKKQVKDLKIMTESPNFVEGTVRLMQGKCSIGKTQAVDIPYGFGIDPASIKAPEGVSFKVVQSTDGIWYLSSTGANGTAEVTLKMGKVKNADGSQAELRGESKETGAALPSDVLQKITDAKSSNLPAISKARVLTKFVRDHLEYSNDSSCNDLYRANPAQYFSAIWSNKKADCDVANTFAAEVLQQAGIQVRLIVGHYVKEASPKGTAILHADTSHAWIEVYDDQAKKWVRLDVTPKGDPIMDQEEQEKDLSDLPNEGDYGEQEAELMDNKKLEELIKELEQAEKDEKQKKEQEDNGAEAKFAREAGCTTEVARNIIKKIEALRKMTDRNGRNLLQESKKAWGDVQRKNKKVKQVYEGPVTMSQGTDLEDPVLAHIEVESEIVDPSGFERFEERTEIEKSFGGFEVYLAADLSGSMGDIDPVSGVRKSEAQRDCLFLFVDSLMSQAYVSKRDEKKLKTPMPVKVCVTSFGKQTEIILPLTDTWGPKEQLKLYRALDQVAVGGTPDHQALNIIKQQIKVAKEEEEQIRKRLKKPDWNMRRFVAVFADGGSDSVPSVRRSIKALREEGTVVYGFGITKSGQAMEHIYAPDGVVILRTDQLVEIGMNALVKTMKEWYGV